MKTLLVLLFFPLIIQAGEVAWPDLKSFKYVSGRIAKEEDIKNKSALFVLKANGKYIGSPIKILLPQYAIHTNEKTNLRTRVVIIQAESAQGINMYGAINIRNGKGIIEIPSTFKLLGRKIKN